MPTITEDIAIKAFEAAKAFPEDEEVQRRATGIRDAYRKQQEGLGKPLFENMARQKAERQRATRRVFQDRETHGLDGETLDKLNAQLRDRPEEKFEVFNERFFSESYGMPMEQARTMRRDLIGEYSEKTWGERVDSDEAFYQKLGEQFDTDDQIAGLAQTAALQGIPAVQAWAQVPDEIKTNPSFQRRQKALLAEFEETAAATDARISPYRQVVTQTIEDLRESMGAGQGDGGGMGPLESWREVGREASGAMDFRDFAQRIVEIPKEDRDLVIAAIIAGAGEGDAKGPSQKLAENFARGVQSIAADTVGAIDRNALRQLQSFANQGAGVDGDATTVQGYLQGLNARIAAAGDPTGAAALAAGMSDKTAPSEEIRKEAAALIETQMEAIDVASDLQQIADGVIDPAKGEYMVTRGLYVAARSIPYTLVAMMPGGIALNTVALTEQSYQTMRRANPDMSRDEAMAISAISGPIQAGLEQIPAAMLTGKLPTLGRFMNQAVATRGGAAARFGVRTAEGVAIEMVQENLQDLTPFAVQGTIAALSDDMPDVPWGDVYGGDFWNQQGELFFATLPLALIGAGAGTVRDFTAARSLMNDPRAVSSIIGNEAKASEIAEAAQSGDYDKAQSLLREGMREVKADRSDLMAVRQKAAAELQADAARKAATITRAEEVGVLPAIGRTAEGWSLKFNDGTARTFENHQEADAARWRYTEEAGLSVAEATRSVIQSVESQLEAGREVAFSFVNERRTLLNAVNEGEVSRDAANRRGQIAEDVGGQAPAPQEESEIDPEQEYQEAFTAAELAAITEDDKLALFQILGSNKTEFADGVQRTTIKLFQGATPLTVIEEKLEGDASAMIASGKRDWLLYSLIRYQRTSGDKVFREGVKSNEDISDADLKEAWSHLGQSYFVGRSRRGDVGDRWKSRNFRKAAAELLRSPVGAAMDGYARFFQSVWKRAAKLNKLRREGKLDADLERELARSVGFGEQAEYEASVETEAAALLREMEESEMVREPLEASTFEPTDDAPFSVMQYRIDHQPHPENSQLHDLTEMFGDDIYGPNALRYFGAGQDGEREVVEVFKRAKGNPDAPVTIYRVVPDFVNEINPGDWVTVSKAAAKGMNFPEFIGTDRKGNPQKPKIISKKVKASEVRWPGDSLLEQGYFPESGDIEAQPMTDDAPFSVIQAGEGYKKTVMPDGMILEGPASFSVIAFHGTPHKMQAETKYRMPDGREIWLSDKGPSSPDRDMVRANGVVIEKAPSGRFRTDKIGTGEGAQAYGWGLYFAESEFVAKDYQRRLGRKLTVDGEVFNESKPRHRASFMLGRSSSIERAIEQLEEEGDIEAAAVLAAEVVKEPVVKDTGNLYTVELLPNDDEFLDWDKPMSEQPEAIQAFFANTPRATLSETDALLSDLQDRGWSNESGITAYQGLARQIGGPPEASKALLAAGIKGIRFLDGNSRADGTGTFNYVIFDDALVRILEENGQPVTEEPSFSVITNATDSAYLAAVESGDMEAAQRMVDDAAKKAGYETRAYHETNEQITEFNPIRSAGRIGIYFSPSVGDGRYGSRTGNYYLSLGRSREMPTLSTVQIDEGFEPLRKKNGIDSLIGVGKDGAIDEYVVFDPNQIKSADPVTYDESGAVIPLSRRFNPARDEISYSVIKGAGMDWRTVRITPAEREFLSSMGSADFAEMLGRRELGAPFDVYSGYIRILPEYVEPLADYIAAVSAESVGDRGRIPPSFYNDEFTKRLRNPESDLSFSVITNAESRIAESFNPFLRNPEQRRRIVLEAQKRSAEQARGFQEIIRFNRSGADIERERKEREGELMGEKLDTLSPSEIGALEASGTLDDIGMRPILSDLVREKYYKTKSGKSVKYWTGSLMSKSAAERAGMDTKGGEWDGIPEGLPPYVWGGSITPDRAANQFGFDSPDEFWTALSAEIASFQNLKADTKAAMTRIRELEREAKAESRVWAEEQKRLRKTVGTDRATLIAAIRTIDAMTASLPMEIRGKMGGMTAVAKLTGPQALLDKIIEKTERLDRVLEQWLKDQATQEAKDFFETVKKKKKTKAGEKASAKALPEMLVVMNAAEEAFKTMSAEQGQARGAEITGLLLSGKVPDKDVAAMQMMAELIPLFSGWNGRTEQQVINGKEVRVRVAEPSSTAQKFAAVEAAKKYWTEGMAEYKRQVAEIKERRDRMREDGMEDVAKANTLRTRDEQKGIEQTRASLPKKFALNIMSFDGFFRWHLGDDSKIYQWVTDSERKAANAYGDAVRAITKSVDDWFTKKGGSRFKGEQLRERMAQAKVTITPEVGEVRTMSQLEMITAKLIWRQEDGKRHMMGRKDENGAVVSSWSYSEGFMAQIDEAISSEALELMDFLSDAYDAEYEPLNKVYRKLFGIDLPKHLLYSPLTVKPMMKGDAGVDSITGFFSGGLSGIAGALKTRGSSIVEPDFKDALQTYVSHSMQMEHFKAYAEFSREARAIFGRVEFRDQIVRASGEEGATVLDGLLEILEKGGIRSSQIHLEATRTLEKLTGRLSTMILFGKLQTVALNVTQLAAASSEMGVATYWKQFGKLWFSPTNWVEALRTPYIQRRIDEMPPVVRQVLESNRKLAPSRLSDMNDKLGYGISASDGFFTAASYAMVYDWKQGQGREMGMDGDLLETWSRNETERIMDRIAQPTRKGARSIFENTLGPEGRAFFNFFSEARKNVALASYATQKDPSKLAGVAQFVFLNAAMSSVIRAAWADLRDDDEEADEIYWNPGKIVLEIAIDPLYGIPVVGGMLQDAIKAAFGFKVFGGSIFESGQNAIPATRRVLTNDYDGVEIDRRAADFNAILGAFGYFSRDAAALTSITNVVEDALKVYDNLVD